MFIVSSACVGVGGGGHITFAFDCELIENLIYAYVMGIIGY